MSASFAVIRKCDCKRAHKNGSYVVRFVHARNKREWACRLCPHHPTLAAAIADVKRRRELREFVLGGINPSWSI